MERLAKLRQRRWVNSKYRPPATYSHNHILQLAGATKKFTVQNVTQQIKAAFTSDLVLQRNARQRTARVL